MNKLARLAVCIFLGGAICVAQDVVSFIHGTIKKVDHATKTIVVKTADGTEHTIKVTGDATIKGTKDGFDGLKEGTEVVARTTGKGVDETAVDVGKVSKDGTWMASLIAGHGHDGGGSGIMGIAPRSRVLSIRVVTDRKDPGYAAYQHESDSRVPSALAQAIGYAVAHKVSVISMSLGYGRAERGGPGRDLRTRWPRGSWSSRPRELRQHPQRPAWANARYCFPADYPGVLGVAAVSVAQNGLTAGFSSDNLSVQVAAPGCACPRRAGTASTGWSAGPARLAR